VAGPELFLRAPGHERLPDRPGSPSYPAIACAVPRVVEKIAIV
jgi:hypothetical protein